MKYKVRNFMRQKNNFLVNIHMRRTNNIVYPSDLVRYITNDCKVGILFRHAERYNASESIVGQQVKLTMNGEKKAINLGKELSGISSISLISSPIHRCISTLSFFRDGHGAENEIFLSKRLGDPGVYFDALSERDCGSEMAKQGFIEYSLKYYRDWINYGCRRLDLASEELQDFINESMESSLTLFNSHDFIVGAFMEYVDVKTPTKEDFVEFLEGVAIIKKRNGKFIFKRFLAE